MLASLIISTWLLFRTTLKKKIRRRLKENKVKIPKLFLITFFPINITRDSTRLKRLSLINYSQILPKTY